MGLEEMLNENLRLAMLLSLFEGGGYSMNDSMLYTYLCSIGHNHSRDKIRAQLSWLAEQNLVTLSGPEGVMVATLTERGDDVAHARANCPGVKRPSPRKS